MGVRRLLLVAACLALAGTLPPATAAPAPAPAPAGAADQQPWDLLLLHVNDNHAR